MLLLTYIQWVRVRTAAVAYSHGDFTALQVVQQMFANVEQGDSEEEAKDVSEEEDGGEERNAENVSEEEEGGKERYADRRDHRYI